METSSHLKNPILVEISAGELLDKISILEIKLERVMDFQKRRNIQKELTGLLAARGASMMNSAPVSVMFNQLKKVNWILWEIEDALRDCERRRDFGEGFVSLARSVYFHNDRRARIKSEINDLVGSELREEKVYANY